MRLGARGPSIGAVLLLAALVALIVVSDDEQDAPGVEPRGEATAQVSRVVDGDTIEVELDGATEDVRYIGIDTPESVAPGRAMECFGPQASKANASLVEGERVRLVFDAELRDRYGRLLAYVYADGMLVNAELVRRGYATTLEIEPNTSKAPGLGRLEQRAGREGRGLWSVCGP